MHMQKLNYRSHLDWVSLRLKLVFVGLASLSLFGDNVSGDFDLGELILPEVVGQEVPVLLVLHHLAHAGNDRHVGNLAGVAFNGKVAVEPGKIYMKAMYCIINLHAKLGAVFILPWPKI